MKFLVQLREEISKWIMRTKNAGTILRIPLLGVTAVSTLVTALRGTGLENYTMGIVGFFGVSAVLFIWAYDRYKVMNLQNRWNADRADNYAGPTMAMNQMVNAVQLGVLSESIKNDWSHERTQEEMMEATRNAVADYRNGINMEEFEK